MQEVNSNIYQYADIQPEALLRKMGFYAPNFDLKELAENMGIKVTFSIDLENIRNDIEGQAYAQDGKPKIWISDLLHTNRKRFTLAHEIGHVVWDILPQLKKHGNKNTETFTDHGGTLSYNRDGSSGISEYYANNFAGRLLMPEKELRLELGNLINKHKDKPNVRKVGFIVPKLAKLFKVSKHTMTIHLLRLGIIEE